MHHLRLLLCCIFLAAAPVDLHGQAARIGRLPLLDTLSTRHACDRATPTSFLRETGTATIIMVTDSVTGRQLSLGVAADQRPTYLMFMMGTTENRRRESESITAMFREGKVIQGDRHAFTGGTPSRLSDDRRSGLLPTDTSSLAALAREVVRRCRDA